MSKGFIVPDLLHQPDGGNQAALPLPVSRRSWTERGRGGRREVLRRRIRPRRRRPKRECNRLKKKSKMVMFGSLVAAEASFLNAKKAP